MTHAVAVRASFGCTPGSVSSGQVEESYRRRAAGWSAGLTQPPSARLTLVPGGDDFVDVVEHIDGESDVGGGELAIELLDGARAESRPKRRESSTQTSTQESLF